MSLWDDPELKPNGTFKKLEQVGDEAEGVITGLRKHRFADGSVSPQIDYTTDDGTEWTLTAGQRQLQAALAEQRPDVGDYFKATLTAIEKRAEGKTLKHISLVVRRGVGVPAAAAPARPAAPAASASFDDEPPF